QPSLKDAMGTRRAQSLLFLLLLGAPSLASVQNLHCHKGVFTSIEEDPSSMFNWTTEKVESCEGGSFCQESLLMVKAGAKTAVLATKGCIYDGTQAVTYVQHSPPPGIITVSYTSYCEDSFCNGRKDLQELWRPAETLEASRVPFYCPTCVALGTCLTAPSLPCPNDTTQCYQGRLQITGGGLNSFLEVKGCTSITGCRLMAGFFTIGPMWVKEVCPYQSLPQPRKAENGATGLPVSVWRFELLLLLLLQ
uniref:Testis expressed 101 n=1 Tax=Panthera tigris altaica TaxID=74533 RepID=A0A8C9KU80_PANTA